jgi:hypothetical protein
MFSVLSHNWSHLFCKYKDYEEDSLTFDRRVLPLVGAAAHESNVLGFVLQGEEERK